MCARFCACEDEMFYEVCDAFNIAGFVHCAESVCYAECDNGNVAFFVENGHPAL